MKENKAKRDRWRGRERKREKNVDFEHFIAVYS